MNGFLSRPSPCLLLAVSVAAPSQDDPLQHYKDAETFEELWAWPEAIQQLKTGIARHPKAPQRHYFLGLAHATRDEAADAPLAIEQFRAELQISSQDARSHYMLGCQLLKQHELSQAQGELQRAAVLEPDSPDPFIDP